MEEWNEFTVSPMDKDVLLVFQKYGMGQYKMYDISYHIMLSDKTALMTIDEFLENCVVRSYDE